MITSITRLIEEATYEVEVAKAAIDKWTAKLLLNPSYEMSWSGDAFAQAARHKVWKDLLEGAESVKDRDNAMEIIIKEVNKNVIRGAMYPERSTSPASNLMNQELTIAWAKALERLSK